MGWWRVRDVETGQIDWTVPTQPICDDTGQIGQLVNAIPGESHIECHFNGDVPADLITFGLNRVELLLAIDGQDVNKKILEPLFFDGPGYKGAEYIPQDISWESFKKALQQNDDVQTIVGLTWLMIRAEYKEAWKREPYPEELRAVFNFCTNGRYKGK
jgi:hypothetical protein